MAAVKFRRLRWMGSVLCVLYAGVVVVLSGCADKLILFPTTQPIPGIAAQRIEINGPGGVIEIWKSRSAGASAHEPVAFVMTFVGNAARAEYDAVEIARQWGKRPVEVWAVNYPGYGGSTGPAKLSSIAPAALAAYDAMKQQAGKRITFASGRSIGTTAALYLAAHRPVSGLILHSPPPLRSLIIGRFGWWNLWLAAVPVAMSVPSDLDSIANGQQVTVPAVFLHTGADTFVTPPYQQKVIDAYAGPKQIVQMPETDHNDAIPDSAIPSLNASLDWLLSQAGKDVANSP